MNRIKQLRKERHLKQEGLALHLNVSQSTISLYEKGDRLPDMETCGRIADFFHVSLDYLTGRSSVRNPDALAGLTLLEGTIVAKLKSLTEEQQEQVDAFMEGLQAGNRGSKE